VLAHPRCARDRAEDIEEVRAMIEGEEYEIASDELRWLLSGCAEFVEAHLLAGHIAINDSGDLPLARGHLGYAWQLGLQAWRRAGRPQGVPVDHPANRPWFEAGFALAWCLEKMGKSSLATEVVTGLRSIDPRDSLGAAAMLDDLRTGGSSIVDLGGPAAP
jgi:hypothetical protein